MNIIVRRCPNRATHQNAVNAPSIASSRLGTWRNENCQPISIPWLAISGCSRYSAGIDAAPEIATKIIA